MLPLISDSYKKKTFESMSSKNNFNQNLGSTITK